MGFQNLGELNGHRGAIYALCHFAHDWVLSAGSDRQIAAWDLERRAPADFSIKIDQTVYSLAYDSPNDLLLIGTAIGEVYIVRVADKSCLAHHQEHSGGIFSICIRGNHFYTGGADGIVSQWELTSGKLVEQARVSGAKIRSIQTVDGFLYIATGEGMIHVLNAQLEEMHKWEAHKMGVHSLWVDQHRIISGGKDAWLKSWDRLSYQELSAQPAHNFGIYDLVSIPEEELIVSVSRDKHVKVWNESNLSFVERLDRKQGGHQNSVNAVLWHTEKKMLITAGDDQTLRLWSKKEAVSNVS